MLLRDYYPAEVLLPDGSMVLRGRVIVDQDGSTRVYDAFQGQPRLRLDTRGSITGEAVMIGQRRAVMVSDTLAGRLQINVVGGCECGGSAVLRRIEGEPLYSPRRGR